MSKLLAALIVSLFAASSFAAGASASAAASAPKASASAAASAPKASASAAASASAKPPHKVKTPKSKKGDEWAPAKN